MVSINTFQHRHIQSHVKCSLMARPQRHGFKSLTIVIIAIASILKSLHNSDKSDKRTYVNDAQPCLAKQSLFMHVKSLDGYPDTNRACIASLVIYERRRICSWFRHCALRRFPSIICQKFPVRCACRVTSDYWDWSYRVTLNTSNLDDLNVLPTGVRYF